MKLNRKPKNQEVKLITLLLNKSGLSFPDDWYKKLLVRQMNDGEMGSLYLFPEGNIIENRSFGEQISEYQFKDSDGVDVIASLNIDDNGELFELDIWKTNFEKLIQLPD